MAVENTLVGLLRESAKRFPNKSAVVAGAKVFSYKRLFRMASQVMAFLRQIGIQKGDNVAIWLGNSPEYVVLYYGIWMLGAAAVPINYYYKGAEMEYIAKNAECKVIITSIERYVAAQNAIRTCPEVKYILIIEDMMKHIDDYAPAGFADIPADQTAVIIYTSGTTGKPKGAMLSHRNIVSNVLSCSKAIEVAPSDSFICFLPLFHSFALTTCMALPLSLGCKVVILDGMKAGPKAVIDSIVLHRVTILIGIPPVFALMANKRIRVPRFLLRLMFPIRLCISGSAPLPRQILERFSRTYSFPLLEGYGLTEAAPVVSLNPIGAPIPGSVGLPLPDVEVKIFGEEGDELPEGKVGEIAVRGPNVMQGYYKDHQSTAETIKNGWLMTGDLGYIDKNGYIFIVGRKKEMLLVRGFNVYPKEIETVLEGHPAVAEAAVVGLKHRFKGDIPVACVVLKKGSFASCEELQKYLRSKLADYKVPSRIVFFDELPKNSLRKVEKFKLLALLKEQEKGVVYED